MTSTTRKAPCDTAFANEPRDTSADRYGAPGSFGWQHLDQESCPGIDESPRASRRNHLRASARYLIASIGCALFALIYAQFSHGVHSPFMSFMFGIPLAGGTLPAAGLAFANARTLPRVTRQAWALTIASLAIASCLRGIFDIAGTSSPYLAAYLAFAGVFAVTAIATLARARNKRPDDTSH